MWLYTADKKILINVKHVESIVAFQTKIVAIFSEGDITIKTFSSEAEAVEYLQIIAKIIKDDGESVLCF